MWMNVQTSPMTAIVLLLSALIQTFPLHARVSKVTLVTEEHAMVSILLRQISNFVGDVPSGKVTNSNSNYFHLRVMYPQEKLQTVTALF